MHTWLGGFPPIPNLFFAFFFFLIYFRGQVSEGSQCQVTVRLACCTGSKRVLSDLAG